jgi:hypothetical protein
MKIGDWYTLCCQKDLAQIDAGDISRIESMIAQDITVDVWSTKLEALQEIRGWWVESGDAEGVEECDRMIAEL